MNDLVLPLDAFVRAIGINRGARHAFFLGAGASITSGVPSAQACIWEWKRDIFLTNNPGLEPQFAELSLSGVRRRIQQWLDRRGIYPPEKSSQEYSFYIEECYPKSPENRRLFFQAKAREAKPHIGYQLLGLLAESGLVGSVWTTNFDQLVSRAATSFRIAPIEVGIDCQQRTFRAPRDGELLIVSMHGDYRYDKLSNTVKELKTQESALSESLIKECEATSLIVSGYSGRDESVMEMLRIAYGQKGPGALFWCVHDVEDVPQPVHDLIELARRSGRQAFLVAAQGFDNTLVRLSLHCLGTEGRERAAVLISNGQGDADLPSTPFAVEQLPTVSVVKSNAFELECPSEILAFDLEKWPEDHVWAWVREQRKDHPVVAVPFKGKVLALGTVDDVRACFGANIKGDVLRVPVQESDFKYEDGAMVSLMREALVRSMASFARVKADDHSELWFTEAIKRGRTNDVQWVAVASMLLFIRQFSGRQYLVLKPSIRVADLAGERVELVIANPVKLSILGYQHNREFNEAVNKWRDVLLPVGQPQVTYEYPPNCGSTFRFKVRRSPIFAEVGGAGRQTQLADKFKGVVKQRGIEIIEPRLVFTSKGGTSSTRDTHPVRGVVTNRPFDFSLTQQGLAPTLRLGIVCPQSETRILQTYLQKAKEKHVPGRYEQEYLPTFPGFDGAFGVPLEIPSPGSAGWVMCGETDPALSETARTIETGKNINRAIESLIAASSVNVVLIFFPERWKKFREFTTDSEHFNTHDFVKAYSVQKGIGTQFLDQSTLSDEVQCRVWWWLALAFYVKSMRTPWVLDGLDEDTAFVGLGFSVKRVAERGQHVVLGCSHIYSSRGEGLQYRLSKVENPVFYGGNPFLSREDARQVGERIRELFFDSRSKLPGRVVIHKRTPFRRDERLGLREGLSGVANIEMLEIYVDNSLRYVASGLDSSGNIGIDDYPVRRGTAVKLDAFTSLLWVHGASLAAGNNERRPYFQGKRRIPAPLVLRRYAGKSDLRMVSEEILGLSKMNWNTFDLYTKEPATIQSSNQIARIGSLLERFGNNSYDFRLFI